MYTEVPCSSLPPGTGDWQGLSQVLSLRCLVTCLRSYSWEEGEAELEFRSQNKGVAAATQMQEGTPPAEEACLPLGNSNGQGQRLEDHQAAEHPLLINPSFYTVQPSTREALGSPGDRSTRQVLVSPPCVCGCPLPPMFTECWVRQIVSC